MKRFGNKGDFHNSHGMAMNDNHNHEEIVLVLTDDWDLWLVARTRVTGRAKAAAENSDKANRAQCGGTFTWRMLRIVVVLRGHRFSEFCRGLGIVGL